MQPEIHPLEKINILSLDVVAGSVASAIFLAAIHGVSISVISILSLAFTVWIIYTTDRLLDVINLKKNPSSNRHYFHKKHFVLFKQIVWIVTLVDIILLFFLPDSIFRSGVILAGLVLIYLLFAHRIKYVKEFLVALIYVLGILLPASINISLLNLNYLAIAIFFLLAYINLVLFSLIERECDENDGQFSLATLMPGKWLYIFLTFLFGLNFILLTMMYANGHAKNIFIVLLVMTFMLLILFITYGKMRRHDIYRLFGDAVFLVPLLNPLLDKL